MSKTLTGTFKTEKDTYSWDGSGTIKYTPIYFSVRVGVIGKKPAISGTWENGEVWTTSDSKGDTWEVDEQNIHLTWPNPNSSGSGSN